MAIRLGLIIFIGLTGVLLQNAGAAKILMMPIYHNSHVNMFLVAAKSLQKAGHDVTLMAPESYAAKIAKTKVKGLIYEVRRAANFYVVMDETVVDFFHGKVGHLQIASGIKASFKEFSNDILSNKTLLDEIEKSKFDFAIVDGIPTVRFFYMIPYKLGIPYMTIAAAYDPWGFGVTALPSVEPGQLIQVSPDMTFFERIANIFSYLMMLNGASLTLDHITDTSEFAPDKEPRTLSYLYAHSEMVLVNLETNCFDYPRVSAPHFRYIAGASAHAPEPLPAHIEDFIADADEGIVVVTFGSMKSLRLTLPFIMDKMLEALGKLKQKVLFSFNPEDLKDFNVPKNVLALDWLPQNDLLGNNKTRLFVTHAGNNGQLESLFHGVPMLAMPFDGDQKYNAMRSKYRGYGETINIYDFTAEEMYKLMQQIIYTPSYKEKIGKCSRIVHSMPTPQETLLFWVNHILEFGGSHLRPVSIDMPLYKMLMLDILLFFVVVLFVTVKLITFLVRFLCRKLCSRKKLKAE